MKNLNRQIFFALAASFLVGSANLVYAENAQTLEDSIRNQIFLELKENVEHLYQNSPKDLSDTQPTVTVNVVNQNIENGFSPPLRLRPGDPFRTINHEVFN